MLTQLWCPLLGVVSCLLLGPAAAGATHQLLPLRSVDLRPYGYSALEKNLPDALLSNANGQVAFLNNDCVAVSFLKANAPPQLSKRDEINGGKFIFHTLFINPIT